MGQWQPGNNKVTSNTDYLGRASLFFIWLQFQSIHNHCCVLIET